MPSVTPARELLAVPNTTGNAQTDFCTHLTHLPNFLQTAFYLYNINANEKISCQNRGYTLIG